MPFFTDWDDGTLIISLGVFAENTAVRFGIKSGRNNPLATGLKLEKFDENNPVGDFALSGVGVLDDVTANKKRPDTAKAVRAVVVRYANKPREVHWSTAISSSEYDFVE